MSEQGGTCVYTCVFGGYETLAEQPVARDSDLPFLCFTDDSALESETWQVVVVPRVLECDAPRSSRHPKVLPHRYLDGHEGSLYIDNSVRLKAPPERILADAFADSTVDLALCPHSFHTSLWEEAAAIEELGLDDPARVSELLECYANVAPALLDQPPHWGGMIFRRHKHEVVRATMEAWWTLILRYSRRDQLSLPLAVAEHPELRKLDLLHDNHLSAVHEWPVAERPGREGYLREPSLARRALVMRSAAQAGEARREAIGLRERLGSTEHALAVAETEVTRLREVVDVQTQSLSWKVTAPFRAVGRGARQRLRTTPGDSHPR